MAKVLFIQKKDIIEFTAANGNVDHRTGVSNDSRGNAGNESAGK